jgi:hypothetical protein
MARLIRNSTNAYIETFYIQHTSRDTEAFLSRDESLPHNHCMPTGVWTHSKHVMGRPGHAANAFVYPSPKLPFFPGLRIRPLSALQACSVPNHRLWTHTHSRARNASLLVSDHPSRSLVDFIESRGHRHISWTNKINSRPVEFNGLSDEQEEAAKATILDRVMKGRQPTDLMLRCKRCVCELGVTR